MSPSPASPSAVSPSHSSDVWADLQGIRRRAPLILNITNFVVMNLNANALLAIGASPVMAHAPEELDEMIALAQALVVNIGTLSREWIDAMERAIVAARRRQVPVVIDPVGSGATRFRTETARRLLGLASPAILRANASEVRSLAGSGGGTRGVDSMDASVDAIASGRQLANEFGCIVSISGSADFVVDASACMVVENGSQLMPSVTGMGCTASALTGAFAAINPSLLHAAANAMALMGVAGELAADKSAGPGTFVPHFLDALYNLGEDNLRNRLKQTSLPSNPA